MNYTTTFQVEQTPQEAYAAINDVRAWWSGEVKGDTDKIGAEFTYTVPDIHYCQMEITELDPGRRVVWRVLDSDLTFTNVRDEWTGTTVVFDVSIKDGRTEVRFEHVGLVPAYDCYDSCSNAWSLLVNGNLRKRISTGEPQPSPFD
jgi:hypothetical protein